MEIKLGCVLLVDDDRATNFLHERLLNSLDCTEKIVTCLDAVAALRFLTTKDDTGFPQPDLVLLDINMPGMNGWEFLDEYDKLKDGQKARLVIVMVTTSLNPDDLERAKKRGISGFLNKPLKKQDIENILRANFPDNY